MDYLTVKGHQGPLSSTSNVRLDLVNINSAPNRNSFMAKLVNDIKKDRKTSARHLAKLMFTPEAQDQTCLSRAIHPNRDDLISSPGSKSQVTFQKNLNIGHYKFKIPKEQEQAAIVAEVISSRSSNQTKSKISDEIQPLQRQYFSRDPFMTDLVSNLLQEHTASQF